MENIEARQICNPSYKVEIIGDTALHLGEGPFWDDEHSLFHVDTFKGDVCRFDVRNRTTEKFNVKDYVSIVIQTEKNKNKFIISRRNQILELDWTSKTYRYITDVGSEKFNDGKVDAKGRLWIGTLTNTVWESNEGSIPNGGALYRLDGCELTRITTMSLPNGMAWSLCNNFFYIVDTLERQIYVWDFNLSEGSIRNKRILLDFNTNRDFYPNELPDGMAIDKYGKLWVAVIFGGRVIRIDPKTGNIERSIKTPALQTSSIAFGGHDYKIMFVTTGNRDLTEEQKEDYPYIGRLLSITGEDIQGPVKRVKIPDCISDKSGKGG